MPLFSMAGSLIWMRLVLLMLPHLTGEKTEAQRVGVTHLRPHTVLAAESWVLHVLSKDS